MKKFLIFIFLLFASFSLQAQDSTLSYLALGDSYTIGESVSTAERWPVQLAQELRQQGLTIKDPTIIAKTGWTTDELKNAIAESELDPPYDLVTLLIGVNDQYRGYDINDYPDKFLYLLDRSISLAGNNPDNVLVLSIPDYGVTPFASEKNPPKISREIEAYNAISKKISDSLGVAYVDITPISRNAEQDSTLLAEDGLHPSGKMYSQWIEETLPLVLPILKQ
ncbi:SGNH/GDSL hydrolase family protein [Balneolaceae bacterium YR4-1]|uniref:SGNH/GDSL hydrolase family protein n=1 Tax=Halalkalibaculum roseum TaxID=2709311 RepID=A0A6M1SLY3_9BACT|nr:SGNH/GDSL hydrolase family protein [Halalkalibaculum roseum]NGP76019.1 SGNH/GDSL hydrolase family protein [Halalkalibaculum roseum]